MRSLYVLLKILFSRISVCAVGIILQTAYLAVLFWTLGTMFSYSYFLFTVIGVVTALHIINGDTSPAYKPIWVFTVLSFPIFGCMFYLYYGRKKTKQRNAPVRTDNAAHTKITDKLLQMDTPAAKQANYISKCGFNIYENTQTRYFSSGENAFPEMIKAIQGSQHFIFLEFFIIEDGVMWGSILHELEKKASEGVDVRVIYDDMGCLLTLPRSYRNTLEEKKIQCRVFGRVKPYWTSNMNNRDHRKILVCDGQTAFTGGINLADEYINLYEKHGYWKDSVIMLDGEAVAGFTEMFIEMWNSLSAAALPCPEKYLAPVPKKSDGFTAPYYSSPENEELIAENIYLNMINSAQKYIYITTPYLILDSAMSEALILAAKSGVDVRIITPHIPDKKLVFELTRANYRPLIKHGIRIYEFTHGFIHAKNFVSDDKIVVVGTVNLDYRSFYLHHECGVWMYGTDSAAAVRDDLIRTMKLSTEVDIHDTDEKNVFIRSVRSLLVMLSPMM